MGPKRFRVPFKSGQSSQESTLTLLINNIADSSQISDQTGITSSQTQSQSSTSVNSCSTSTGITTSNLKKWAVVRSVANPTQKKIGKQRKLQPSLLKFAKRHDVDRLKHDGKENIGQPTINNISQDALPVPITSLTAGNSTTEGPNTIALPIKRRKAVKELLKLISKHRERMNKIRCRLSELEAVKFVET